MFCYNRKEKEQLKLLLCKIYEPQTGLETRVVPTHPRVAYIDIPPNPPLAKEGYKKRSRGCRRDHLSNAIP